MRRQRIADRIDPAGPWPEFALELIGGAEQESQRAQAEFSQASIARASPGRGGPGRIRGLPGQVTAHRDVLAAETELSTRNGG